MRHDAVMNNEPNVPAIAVRAPVAARMLAVSERTLWVWVADPQMAVPVLRQGRCVLFPVAGLRDWLAARSTPTVAKVG